MQYWFRPVSARVSSLTVRALERIYVEYAPLVRATLRARGVPPSAVDDVLHDVFLTAHAKLHRRDGSVPLSAWLIGLARNAAFSFRRGAARRRRRHQVVATRRVTEPVGDDEVDARRAWEVVTTFLRELPARQREAFMLCHVAQFPASELARVWGCSTNTVHSRLRLARARFALRFPDASGAGDHEAVLAAARREIDPAPPKQRQAWALLVADLARPWWASLVTAKAGAFVVAAAGAVVIAFAVPVISFDADDASAPPRAAADPVPPTENEPATARAPTPSDPTPDAQRLATVTVGSAPEPPAEASVPPLRTRPRIQRAPKGAVAHAPDPQDPGVPDLQRETALLARARADLRSGAPENALSRLRDHEREFPTGTLVTERRRLKVDVLCRLGRVDEARKVVSALDRAAPERAAGRTRGSPCGR